MDEEHPASIYLLCCFPQGKAVTEMITVAIIIVLVGVASLLSYVFSAKNSSVKPTEATKHYENHFEKQKSQ